MVRMLLENVLVKHALLTIKEVASVAQILYYVQQYNSALLPQALAVIVHFAQENKVNASVELTKIRNITAMLDTFAKMKQQLLEFALMLVL